MQFIILAVTFLILLVNVLAGMRKRFAHALLRLITLIVAVVAAFFIAKTFSPMLAQRFGPNLAKIFASVPNFESFLQENPDVALSVSALVQMLVTPLLFVLCYLVLKGLTWGLYVLVSPFVKKTKILLFGRIGGAVVGLLCGFIGVLVFITPTLGYTKLISRTLEETAYLTEASRALDQLKPEEYNQKYITPASNTPVASALYNGLGSKLFDALTTAEWDGNKTKLETEWFAVLHVAKNASKLIATPAAQYGEAESEAAHALCHDVADSMLLSSLSSGAFNGVSNAWLADQSFIGIYKPETGDESVDIILNGFLRVFSTTDKKLIGEDLEFFADLFELLIKHDVFAKINEGESTDALVVHLVTSGFLGDARALLAENPRMQPVVDAISDAGMRLLVRELGDPSVYLEQHGELIGNISEALKGAVSDGQIDVEKATEKINQALAEKSVSVPSDATKIIATGLADEFTVDELSSLTTEEIANRVVERLGSVENISSLIK